MPKDTKEESLKIFSNEALRGKPYLDIDRVITESISAYAKKETKTKKC